jgi:hypothetical protein
MDIYENIVIGNFLFGLGTAMGLRHRTDGPIAKTHSHFASLLQQTPLDKSFGDVLLGSKNSRIIRLIEFKRAANDSRKEQSKLAALLQALTTPGNSRLQLISRKIHWYVESEFQTRLKIRIAPYMDLQYLDFGAKFTNLQKFVEAIADAASNSSIGKEEMRDYLEYLDLVCKCQESDDYLSDTASSGALCLQITAGGQLRYVAVANFRDLFRDRREIERDREIERGPSRGYDR